MSSAVRGMTPNRMLQLYVFVVLVTGVITIGSVLVMWSRVDDESQQSAEQSQVAVTLAQIQADLRAPISTMLASAFAFMSSDAMAGLPADARQAFVEDALTAVQQGQEPADLPSVPVPISERNAFEVQREVATISQRIDQLGANTPEVDLSAIVAERDQLDASLREYLDTKSAASFASAFASMFRLGSLVDETNTSLGASLADSRNNVASASETARYTMVIALIALTVTMVAASFYVNRMIHRAFASGEAERKELRDLSATLRYRNDQLNALYNVFSEITDTLSMRYVISATLKETLRVMRATMVTLRLLRDGELVMAGNLTDDGREILNMPPVPLGEGPTGRVARRGRSMRIDRGAQDQLGPPVQPEDPDAGVESGIIVPLIVGARVVGTLACWSKHPEAFEEEDERVLEMMASQVATAVIAADTTEMYERRALQDPLTGLPNRRQLTQDIEGRFSRWKVEDRCAVVAMVDVDHFKRLNDDFGHKVGDVTLQKVATVMRQSIRESDTIYRYGGEEFVVILEEVTEQEALALMNRMVKAVAETPLSGNQLEPVGPVTVSAGLALMPEHSDDFLELIELADKAMYQAKGAGRNRIVVWSESEPVRATLPAA